MKRFLLLVMILFLSNVAYATSTLETDNGKYLVDVQSVQQTGSWQEASLVIKFYPTIKFRNEMIAQNYSTKENEKWNNLDYVVCIGKFSVFNNGRVLLNNRILNGYRGNESMILNTGFPKPNGYNPIEVSKDSDLYKLVLLVVTQ